MQKACWKIWMLESEGYDDFIEKYGGATEETPVKLGIFRTGWFFNG